MDGLRYNPTTNLLWVLQNQDGNSALETIDPTNGLTTKYGYPSGIVNSSSPVVSYGDSGVNTAAGSISGGLFQDGSSPHGLGFLPAARAWPRRPRGGSPQEIGGLTAFFAVKRRPLTSRHAFVLY